MKVSSSKYIRHRNVAGMHDSMALIFGIDTVVYIEYNYL